MDDADDDSDVQLEDEWEVVGGSAHPSAAPAGGGDWGEEGEEENGETAAAEGEPGGGAGGDILITLEDPDATTSGGKRAARTYTREQREAIALAHRTHALCLLVRCIMHDVAGSDLGLQVGGGLFWGAVTVGCVASGWVGIGG